MYLKFEVCHEYTPYLIILASYRRSPCCFLVLLVRSVFNAQKGSWGQPLWPAFIKMGPRRLLKFRFFRNTKVNRQNTEKIQTPLRHQTKPPNRWRRLHINCDSRPVGYASDQLRSVTNILPSQSHESGDGFSHYGLRTRHAHYAIWPLGGSSRHSLSHSGSVRLNSLTNTWPERNPRRQITFFRLLQDHRA